MSDSSDAYVNAKVDPEQKAEFEAYAEEDPNTDSLSHLVRKSLLREVNDDHAAGQQPSNAREREQLADIKDDLRQVRSQLESLHTTVEAIAARTQEPAEDIKELSSDVFGVLPTGKDHIWKWERKEIPPSRGPESDPVAHSGSVTAIANILGEKDLRVHQALDHLREDTHRVQTITVDGESRFYKEV